MIGENQFEEYDPTPESPDSEDTSRQLTHAQALALASAKPTCDYMTGGKRGRREQGFSTCGNEATHFVYTKTHNPSEPSLHELPLARSHGTYLVCAEHADSAAHNVTVDELHEHAKKNPNITTFEQLEATLPSRGDAVPLESVPNAAKPMYMKAYGDNLMKYLGKKFKKREPEAYEPIPNDTLSLKRAENETPAQHLGRRRAAVALATQVNSQIRSARQIRREQGIDPDLKKPGRPYDVNESNEVEVRTRDRRKSDEGLIRLHLALKGGRLPSGLAGDRVTPAMRGVHDYDPYTSTGFAPMADPSTSAEIMPEVIKAKEQEEQNLQARRLEKYGEDYLSNENVTRPPKAYDENGNLVPFFAKEGFDAEGNVIDTSSKYGHVTAREKKAENPDSITVKVHPTRRDEEGGAIAWHEGRAVHVHQIPAYENLDKLILKHGIENLGSLPPEAFGRIKTIAVGSKKNPAQQDILDENGEYSHSEPTTSMSRYYWIPSTRQATHPDGRPLTKADVTRATNVAHRQALSNRRSAPEQEAIFEERANAVLPTKSSEFTEGTAGR